jgi:LAO/AO transport system kinase
VRTAVPDLEKAVLTGELTPALAAQEILQTFLTAPRRARPSPPDRATSRDHGVVTTT